MSMNVTFMIGNGFDINLGLSTQYKDFVEVYRNIQSQDNDVIRRFKKEIIDSNLPLWANAELAFGEQTSFISNGFTVKDYCACHEHFCRALAGYLINEQNKLILNKDSTSGIVESFSKAVNNIVLGFRATQRDEINSLFSKYDAITFNFINFNYTNTLERICAATNASIGWQLHRNGRNAMGMIIPECYGYDYSCTWHS